MAMLRRLFATERFERAPGQFCQTHLVRCGHPGCGAIQRIFFKVGNGAPTDAIYKKFCQKEWHVDLNDPAGDRCPFHKNGRAAIRIVTGKKETRAAAEAVFAAKPAMPELAATARIPAPNVTKENTVSNVTALPNAQPSLADRRLIFAKLNEVYIDERSGYKAPWDDEAVAKDLGIHIPVEWVRSIRAENFGALNSNGELVALVSEARKFSDEAWAAVEELRKSGPLLTKALAMQPKLEALTKRLDEISKALGVK